jgi:hypothetical protein
VRRAIILVCHTTTAKTNADGFGRSGLVARSGALPAASNCFPAAAGAVVHSPTVTVVVC